MADQPNKGIMRWITTTNHKDIGTLYLLFSLTMFFVAGFLALIMRTELSSPYLMVLSPFVQPISNSAWAYYDFCYSCQLWQVMQTG